jgi:aminopeptidase N
MFRAGHAPTSAFHGRANPLDQRPMRTEEPRTVRLENYRPPDWLIETVKLDVALHPTATRVRAKLHVRPNGSGAPAPLVLDGDELTLHSIRLDGKPLPAESFVATPDRLTIAQAPHRPFELEIETVLDPTNNTKLMGLYRAGSTYCTQCEAEGFRRITYFLDRPDVMAVYTTRIEAEKKEARVLLANGNLVAHGDIAGTSRHFAVWHDPFPKPSYLFALVGGNLGCVKDSFTTMSGRNVTLAIYVEPGKEDRCTYAMDSLKRAMRWDEVTFGREYDLDIFMIVAVSAFNMGAMENKGLNVFNDKYVLASPATATDGDYAGIEAVIAHEYFHNWTGDLPRPGIHRRPAVARRRAHQRCPRAARISVRRGCGAAGTSGAAHALSRDQQFLHRNRLPEGRRGCAHDQDAARPASLPRRHGPLLRAPRRPSGDG